MPALLRVKDSNSRSRSRACTQKHAFFCLAAVSDLPVRRSCSHSVAIVSGKGKGHGSGQWHGQWWEHSWRGGAPSSWDSSATWSWQDDARSDAWRGGAPRCSEASWLALEASWSASGKGAAASGALPRSGSGVRRQPDWDDDATEGGATPKAKARAPRCKGTAFVEERVPEQWRNILGESELLTDKWPGHFRDTFPAQGDPDSRLSFQQLADASGWNLHLHQRVRGNARKGKGRGVCVLTIAARTGESRLIYDMLVKAAEKVVPRGTKFVPYRHAIRRRLLNCEKQHTLLEAEDRRAWWLTVSTAHCLPRSRPSPNPRMHLSHLANRMLSEFIGPVFPLAAVALCLAVGYYTKRRIL